MLRRVHDDINQLCLQHERGYAEQDAAVSKSRLNGSCCVTYYCTSGDAPMHVQQSWQGVSHVQILGPLLLCCKLPHLLHRLCRNQMVALDVGKYSSA